MAKGRKKLPIEIKDLQGTLRKGRDNPEHVVSSGKIEAVTEAPKYFSTSEKIMFLDICRDLINSGVLENPDIEIVAKLVMENTRYYDAMKAMRKSGYTKIDPRSGKSYQAPENAIAANALRAVMSLSAELGLTPAARARLKLGAAIKEPEKPKSPMQNLLD